MPTSHPRPVVDMGDYQAYAGDHRLSEAHPGEIGLTVVWDDGERATFHWLWLRDNCACEQCRHPRTRERLFELISLPHLQLTGEARITEAGALRLVWSQPEGTHESLFDPGWLRTHACAQRPDDTPPREPWISASGEIPSVDHHSVMHGDDGLRHWLTEIATRGCALLTGGPVTEGEVMRIAERVGWPRQTNFGRMFDVVSRLDPNNAAYTSLPLEPHVDLPNWERPPDFQLLYCLSNEASGGASTLTDGLAVAEALKRKDPEAFEVLSTEAIEFRFQDETSDIRCRAPLLEHDADGRLRRIRFNNWIRGAVDLPLERLDAFYRGYARFWEMLRDPAYMIRFRLQPGQMIAFDNLRVLHGRDAFEASTGHRHLQGLYLDRDLVLSRLRVLQRVA